MLRINIVYQNNNMPADVLPDIPAPDHGYTVTWSRQPQPTADVVVYFNHYTYRREVHQQICPQAAKVLYMYEPVAVDPVQYTKGVWQQFDAVMTWNTYLTQQSDAFIFEAGAYYDLPYTDAYGVKMLPSIPKPAERERAICQMIRDKYSLAPEACYALRREAAHWFARNARTRMDVYGKQPMPVRNYIGPAPKELTFSRYRYALCFENTYHPQWSHGYLSEKMFDCMALGTVPIYYGCSNIEALVPPECYLDYRAFSSWAALDEKLQTMSDQEYLDRVHAMREFFTRYNPPHTHSIHRMYETVARWQQQRPARPIPPDWPADYWDLSSGPGRMRLTLMRWLLPHHRYCDPWFKIVRTAHHWCHVLSSDA